VSLTARLSAFFLAALAVVLAGFSVSLYLLAWAHLSRQVDDRLEAALDTLTAAVEREPGWLEWEPHQRDLVPGRAGVLGQVRWEVRDERGLLVDRSPNLGAAGLEVDAPPDGIAQLEREGVPWRFAGRRVPAPPAGDSPPPPPPGDGPPARRYSALVLTAGLSLEPIRETLRRLALTLAGLSAGLWLLGLLASRWVCRRALAPVTRMAEAARAMRAADLDQRLPGPSGADELGELRGAFNGLLDRLQEAFERQRRFTGDASHQLRTPLTALAGQVEVALRRDRPAEDYRRALEQAHAQATHLRRIVEALLFLARADAEAALGSLEVMDLTEWLPAHLAGWSAHPRAADLRLEAGAGPCPVRAQPLLLGQALDNLLENALKHSEAGPPVTVSLARDGNQVVLGVADAGEGIAPEDLPHVFEPFYRSAEARRRGRAGVGLGLAVVKRVTAALGGSAAAESGAGTGSRFTLCLPAAEGRPR
jgi:heavy metal sensor kinase